MKAFRCRVCDNPLHFENSVCVSCGTNLGFSRAERAIVPVDDEGRYVDSSGLVWHVCRNLNLHGCTWLASLEGGCQVPIGAAVVRAAGVATLHGFIASVDGARVVRGERTLDEQAPASTGEALGSMVRSRGGDAIIGELRANGSVPSPQPE